MVENWHFWPFWRNFWVLENIRLPISIEIVTNVKLSRTYYIRPEDGNIYDFVSNYFTKTTENLKIKFFWNFGPKYDCGAWIWFWSAFCPFSLIFIPLYQVVVEFSWYVVEFCSPFVDFQSCFDSVFLGGFVKFCSIWLSLAG